MSAQWPPPDASTTPPAPGSSGPGDPWTQNAGAQFPRLPRSTRTPSTRTPARIPQTGQLPTSPSWAQPGQAYPPGAPTYWTVAPPQPLSDQQPPRPPRRSGWPVALFGIVGVVLLGVVAVLAVPFVTNLQLPADQDQNWTVPSQSSPGSKSSSSPKPTGSPTATMPSDPEDVLKKNPVYAIKVPAECPAQSIPSGKASFRTQVKALVDCENTAWRKALAATPVTFSKPKVVFYNTTQASPCGRLGTVYPAAYCTGDRTLYFSTAAYAQGRYYRLAVAQFVMHEYAHHVQELAGIFDADLALDEARGHDPADRAAGALHSALPARITTYRLQRQRPGRRRVPVQLHHGREGPAPRPPSATGDDGARAARRSGSATRGRLPRAEVK